MTEGETTARAQGRFGPYQIVGPLGRGGMGVVYRAMDLNLGRIVAVKVLHDHLRARPQCVTRLQREARAIAGLNHPGIVQVYSVGEIGNIAYFAMEYVEGRPLSTVLLQEGPMPWQRAINIAHQIADALTCAHEAQIIHRDVKPPNIILTADDRVFVTDFGVAKVLTAETQLTVDASRLGTPSYMSPEHCQNQEVTASSDLYSLGVLIFQMISGRLPHEASSRAELAEKIIGSPPARLRDFVPNVPEGVDRLVAHMLEKRPKDRPANGRVLLELMERVSHGGTLDEDCRDRVAVMATLRESLNTARHTPVSSGDETAGKHPKHSTPTPKPRPRASSGERSSTHGFRTTSRRWLMEQGSWRGVAWVLVIWAGLCSATTGTLLAQWQPASAILSSDATALDRWKTPAAVARFSEAAPGVTLARLETANWPVASAGWLDAGTGVVVLSGREGKSGLVLCPLNPEANSAFAYFVQQPDGLGPAAAVLDFGSAIRRESPLGDRLLVSFAKKGSAAGGLAAVVPPPRQAAALTVFAAADRANVAAARPDGAALAVVTAAQSGVNAWIVGQQDVGFAGPSGAPHPLTRPGAPVTALQYSPDGSRLAYLRQPPTGQAELWVVRTNGTELDGIMLAQGSLAIGPNAFSPDGSRIAVANGPTIQGRELQVHYSNASAFDAAGSAQSVAWHPSGDFLVVTAPGDDDRLQLWAVRGSSPYTRTSLTRLPSGVGPLCRISPDGTRALAFAEGADTPTVVFVDLQRNR